MTYIEKLKQTINADKKDEFVNLMIAHACPRDFFMGAPADTNKACKHKKDCWKCWNKEAKE